MSPMPTPEWEQWIQDQLRWGRRATREDHTPDRRDNADRASAGSSPHLPDPRLLAPVGPATQEAMKAHRNWAQRYAPWLLEEWLR